MNKLLFLSNNNYSLAFELRQELKKINIEVDFCNQLSQLLLLIDGSTQIILIEIDSLNFDEILPFFDLKLQEKIYFVLEDKIYNAKKETVFNSLKDFIQKCPFLCSNIYEPHIFVVEEVFKKCDIPVSCWQAIYIKELLKLCLQENLKQTNKQIFLKTAGSLGMVKHNILDSLKPYLKKYFKIINDALNLKLEKYSAKALLNGMLAECIKLTR